MHIRSLIDKHYFAGRMHLTLIKIAKPEAVACSFKLKIVCLLTFVFLLFQFERYNHVEVNSKRTKWEDDTIEGTLKFEATAALRYQATSYSHYKFMGDQGQIVQLSPDGRQAFISKYQTSDNGDDNSIYLFERRNDKGQDGWTFKDVIFACEKGYALLRFQLSGDGNYLAASCGLISPLRLLYKTWNGQWKLDTSELYSDRVKEDNSYMLGFGESLSISHNGGVVAVSEVWPNREHQNGTVYVFQKMISLFGTSSWRKHVLRPSEKLIGPDHKCSSFGVGVAISGDGKTVAVMAHRRYQYPCLFIFQQDDFYGDYEQIFTNTEPTMTLNERPCGSLSLSHDGRLCVLGVCQRQPEFNGGLTVYVRNDGENTEWTKSDTIKAQDVAIGGSSFGAVTSLSLDGNVLLTCGSLDLREDNNTGSCWVFARTENNKFIQQGPKYGAFKTEKDECPSPCLKIQYGRSGHLTPDASAFIVGGSVRMFADDYGALSPDGGGANIYERIEPHRDSQEEQK